MSDTQSKPLTPSELADLKAKAKADRADDFTHLDIPIPTILRLINMIERRDEQIEKLRGACKSISSPLTIEKNVYGTGTKRALEIIAEISNTAREALAATEPPK